MPGSNTYNTSAQWSEDALYAYNGKLPTSDSIDGTLQAWKDLKVLIENSAVEGSTFVNPIGVTYAISSSVYKFPLLDSSGNVLFLSTGSYQKMTLPDESISADISYLYTTGNAYQGGVLAANGDIHLVPGTAPVGHVITPSGLLDTYSLIYTSTSIAYCGGVLTHSGDIHFIPNNAPVGQKIGSDGVVSTYSLINTAGGYLGGVLAPNGDIHFVPTSAPVGQKINASGVVSTYSLIYTLSTGAYAGGVLAPNGDIHFAPYLAANNRIGQKVNINGVVSTYQLPVNVGTSYGGVALPDGSIVFIPYNFNTFTCIKKDGEISIVRLVKTSNVTYGNGGVLAPNGVVYLGHTTSDNTFTKILPGVVKPWGLGTCLSPFFNRSF